MATNNITFLLFVIIVTNYALRRHIINHRILSAKSKVRVSLQNSIKHSGSERVKESFFPHPRLTLSLIPMHSYLTIDFFSFQEILGPNINNVLTWMTCPKKVALVWTEPLRLINWALIPTVEEVWRHVTMVAKFLDLNNLSWQRRPFVLSNDGKKIVGYRFVPECNQVQESHTCQFLCFFCHTHGSMRSRKFFSTMATWRPCLRRKS